MFCSATILPFVPCMATGGHRPRHASCGVSKARPIIDSDIIESVISEREAGETDTGSVASVVFLMT